VSAIKAAGGPKPGPRARKFCPCSPTYQKDFGISTGPGVYRVYIEISAIPVTGPGWRLGSEVWVSLQTEDKAVLGSGSRGAPPLGSCAGEERDGEAMQL
jgi:hypothetical protein